VAFLYGPAAGHCELAIYDLSTGAVRPILDLPHPPLQLSWSWDDSEIAYARWNEFHVSVQAIALRDGSVRTIIPSDRVSVAGQPPGTPLMLDSLEPLQWSHDGQKMVTGLSFDIPTKTQNVHSSEPRIAAMGRESVEIIGMDRGVAVSPVSDRAAWYGSNDIYEANIDGSVQRVISRGRAGSAYFPGVPADRSPGRRTASGSPSESL